MNDTTHSSSAYRSSMAWIVTIMATAFLWPVQASAEGMDLQHFYLMSDQQNNYLFSPGTDVEPRDHWSAHGVLNAARNPLVLRRGDGERETSLVSSQTRLHLLGSYVVYDDIEVGLDLPLVVQQGGDENPPPGVSPVESGWGVGDVRLSSRAQFFATEDEDEEVNVAIAGMMDLHLPTGSKSSLQGGDFRIGPTIATDIIFDSGQRMGFHVGYQFRPSTRYQGLTVDDTMRWGLSGLIPVSEDVEIIGELLGRVTPSVGFRRTHSPTEFVAGGKASVGAAHLLGGIGLGLVRGYGTPDWRGFVGVGVPMNGSSPR